MRTTPFHVRFAELNETHLWEHWAGYLSAIKYGHSVDHEYFAIRNSVGVFDTSPLFKYRISGAGALDFLGGILARDPNGLAVGAGHYTAWCDDDGYVLEDGVLLRVGADHYSLTSTQPNLRYLERMASGYSVSIDDVSTDFGILSIQGPHSIDVLDRLTPDARRLPYFGLEPVSLADVDVVLSRTGFTGDLGYEIWVPTDRAVAVLDAVMEAGADYNIVPVGSRATTMARLDAGLLLLGADYSSARFAWSRAQKETLDELGLGWMVPAVGDRQFVGRAAIQAERSAGSSRWRTVGVMVDPLEYEALYNLRGVVAPKAGVYSTGSRGLYDRDFSLGKGAEYVGYLTSFMFSPMLKRIIGIGKVQAAADRDLFLELTVDHRPEYVRCRIESVPFFNPGRKTARLEAVR